MSISPDRPSRRSGLDGDQSTVQHLMSQARQRQQEQKTRGRGKPGHAGQRGMDKRGVSKATYNISIARQDLVTEMARAEQLTKADVVEAAIVAFYNAWQAGRVDLEDLKVISYSQKQPWRSTVRLDLPDDFALFSGE